MHDVSAFVTLTYDDEHYSPSLNYSDFQRFMKRVRKRYGATRFFMCGEYGENTLRPHFHALLFGRYFERSSQIGRDLWRSSELERLWPFGHSSFGEVTLESAGYCARYSVSKVSGPLADSHYCRVDHSTGEFVYVTPEFGHMSLKPGIGWTWFQKYWRDVYAARDGVVLKRGQTVPAPRYYDNLLLELDSGLREFKDFERYRRSLEFSADGTRDRLAVREAVAFARLKFNKRSTL